MEGPNSPTNPVDEFARRIAGLQSRIEDLERTAQRPRLVTLTYNDTIDSGTATTLTLFASHGALLPLVAPTRMVVSVSGYWGQVSALNASGICVLDELGANITRCTTDTVFGHHDPTLPWQPFSVLGVKDYAAGAVAGFYLAYFVTTSNVFIRTGTKVDFVPL